MKKAQKKLEKKSFLNSLGLLFSAREKVLNSFKSRLLPVKKLDKVPTREPTPEKAAEPVAKPTLKVATEPTPRSCNRRNTH